MSISSSNLYRDLTTANRLAGIGGPTVTATPTATAAALAQALPSQERGFSLTYDSENSC